MAAPFPTTYFLGIGTAISNLGVPTELSGGSYARLACGFTGTAMSGLTQTVGPWVVATAPTPAVPCVYGLMFDALTGGNLVAYWNWAPGTTGFTGSLTAFPSTVINVSFTNNIAIAMNLALTGGPGTSGSLFDAGAQIGTVNGNPMLSGVRLAINSGGSLVPHTAGGQWMGSADVQGTLAFGSLLTTNVNNGVTALAGGANSTLTPVLSSFFNRVTTVTTTLDSVALPALSQAPVGSILTVVNSAAANVMTLFPDSGAVINAAATSLTIAHGASCLFCRVTPTQWITVPTVPS